MTLEGMIESIIHSLYRRYDIKNAVKQRKQLLDICLCELEEHPDVAKLLRTQTYEQLEFFVMQLALENIG